jgi:hypothetical protein
MKRLRPFRFIGIVSASILTVATSACVGTEKFRIEPSVTDIGSEWATRKIPGRYRIAIDASRAISARSLPSGVSGKCVFTTDMRASYKGSIIRALHQIFESPPDFAASPRSPDLSDQLGDLLIRVRIVSIAGGCRGAECYASVGVGAAIQGTFLNGRKIDDELFANIQKSEIMFGNLSFCRPMSELIDKAANGTQYQSIKQVGQKLLSATK